jgi:hypothetical protein
LADVKEDSDGTGTLSIRSDPVGAQIFVDGVHLGITPLSGQALSPGSHVLRLELPGYASVSKVVTMRSGQALTQTYPLEILEPLTGFVTLWGEGLDSAELFADGNYVGELPVKVQLSEGRHAFRVKAAEGDEFTVTRDLHFDVQGIGITIELSR